MVCPTISGVTVERRDHVRMTFLSFLWFMSSILFNRWPSICGPFFNERAIYLILLRPERGHFCLLFTMNSSVRLLLRVLYPRVGWPQGVTGWRPPEVLPSPPPWGWSTGFIATPRLTGFFPSQRLRPALPLATFSWSTLPIWPMVAMQSIKTLRVSPDGSLTRA